MNRSNLFFVAGKPTPVRPRRRHFHPPPPQRVQHLAHATTTILIEPDPHVRRKQHHADREPHGSFGHLLRESGGALQGLQDGRHAAPYLLHGSVRLPQHAVHTPRPVVGLLGPFRFRKNHQLPALRAVSSHSGRLFEQNAHRRETIGLVDRAGEFRQLSDHPEFQRHEIHADLQLGLRPERVGGLGVHPSAAAGEEPDRQEGRGRDYVPCASSLAFWRGRYSEEGFAVGELVGQRAELLHESAAEARGQAARSE